MPADDITISLELPGFRVTRQTTEPDRYVIWIEPTAYGAVCPRCGRASADYHDGYERIVREFPILGRPVFLRVWQRRFNLWGSDSPKLASLGIALRFWVFRVLIPRSLLRGRSFVMLVASRLTSP